MSAAYSETKAIERAVMADHNRPCLYNAAGPCQHPNCLEAHFATLWRQRKASQSDASAEQK
jgi:hypothetical protein